MAQVSLTKQTIDQQLLEHERYLLRRMLLPNDSDWKPLNQSLHSKNTVNPVRRIADACQVPPNHSKRLLKLHLGDPSLSGLLPPPEAASRAVHEAIDGRKFDGYGLSVGHFAAREAICRHFSTPTSPFNPDDVVLASGCSHALQMAIEALVEPGDNLLVPQPGFPLYSTICQAHNVIDKHYRIEMRNGVRVDLSHLESLIDEKTKAIVVNNPGNPTGAVFTKRHLEEILRVAEKYKLVIIADEIYGDLVYNDAVFHPIATLSPKVPIISCDGIAKRWMVPGWRMGWLIIHDHENVLSEIRKGIIALSQKIVGPCALIQGALPKILDETPASYFDRCREIIQTNANIVNDVLRSVEGIHCVMPQGAMYMMIGVDRAIYTDDVTFCQSLIKEQSVFCLPGQAFSAPGFFRIVLTCSAEDMREAANRVKEFCLEHRGQPITSDESSDEGCDIGALESD